MDPQKQSNRPPSIGYATSDSPRAGKTAIAATFADQFEANLARNLLEQNGIQCFATGEALLGGVGTYVGAMQRLDVFVAESDLEDAKRLLRSIGERRTARLRDPIAPPCPKCGAVGARKRLGRGSLALICAGVGCAITVILQNPMWIGLSLFPAVYLIFTWERQRWTCAKCEAKFSAKAVDVTDEAEE